MNRHIFEAAAESDAPEMLALMEEGGSSGSLSLVFTRRPDPLLSYKTESPHADVVVLRDDHTKSLKLQCARISRQFWIGGKARDIGYICGLRKSHGFIGAPWLKMICERYRLGGDRLHYCSILGEGAAFLQKQRPYMPDIYPACSYRTFIRRPRRKIPCRYSKHDTAGQHVFHFRQAEAEDLPALLQFWQTEGRRYNFFPVIRGGTSRQALIGEIFPGLGLDDIYLLESAGPEKHILATGALWNQSFYRQYLVKNCRGFAALLRSLNWISPLLGYPPIPAAGKVLNFPLLSLFIVKDANQDYMEIFLKHIESRIAEFYPFYVSGAVEGSPAHRLFSRCKTIGFDSSIFLMNHGKIDPASPELRGPYYFECGLL